MCSPARACKGAQPSNPKPFHPCATELRYADISLTCIPPAPAQAQQEFSIESIQYAGVACYQSAHAEVDLRHADVVLQALERRFASVWGQDGEGGGGEGRTADADDVMIARTGLWDPARHDELRAVKQLMMTQDDTTAEHPPGGTAVRVVESDDSCDSEGFRLRPMVRPIRVCETSRKTHPCVPSFGPYVYETRWG